jgi:hypothetical protein
MRRQVVAANRQPAVRLHLCLLQQALAAFSAALDLTATPDVAAKVKALKRSIRLEQKEEQQVRGALAAGLPGTGV